MSALSERDFRVVWTGQAISMTGTWMQMIAQGLLVLTLWNSALALGLLTFANALPSIVVMLFGGVLADRADKRRILLATQMVMGALALAVGLLVVADAIQYWMLIAATIGLGVAFGYDMPAYQAFLPELVPPEKIGQVVALNSSTFHGSRMVGPAMAGAIISALGIAAAYFLNASLPLSSVCHRRRRPATPEGPAIHHRRLPKEGIRMHAVARNLRVPAAHSDEYCLRVSRHRRSPFMYDALRPGVLGALGGPASAPCWRDRAHRLSDHRRVHGSGSPPCSHPWGRFRRSRASRPSRSSCRRSCRSRSRRSLGSSRR
jgi:MFS family permease